MNERAYKAMSFAGAVNIAVGIVIAVVGVAAGVLAIISGARLLREKKGPYFFKKSGLKGCLIFEFKEQKRIRILGRYCSYCILYLLFTF